jgi:hypothetical protein
MAYPRGTQEWQDEFARRREAVVESLRSAIASSSDVVCRPCNGAFTFGWQFEQGDTGFPTQVEGSLDYAFSYIRHMINQGFLVGVGICTEKAQATVYLKAWEDEEPSWPAGFTPAVTVYSRPMTLEESA